MSPGSSERKRQLAQNLAQVVACPAQQGIHGITLGALEEVSPQPSIRFHVSNHRLHGITTLELFSDGHRHTPLGPSDPHLESILDNTVAPVAPIHVCFLKHYSSQPLYLFQRCLEGVPVIRVTRESSHADDETLFAGTHYTHFDAKLVGFMRFAFGDAFNFGGMNTVHLAFVVTLLGVNAQAKLKQPLELVG